METILGIRPDDTYFSEQLARQANELTGPTLYGDTMIRDWRRLDELSEILARKENGPVTFRAYHMFQHVGGRGEVDGDLRRGILDEHEGEYLFLEPVPDFVAQDGTVVYRDQAGSVAFYEEIGDTGVASVVLESTLKRLFPAYDDVGYHNDLFQELRGKRSRIIPMPHHPKDASMRTKLLEGDSQKSTISALLNLANDAIGPLQQERQAFLELVANNLVLLHTQNQQFFDFILKQIAERAQTESGPLSVNMISSYGFTVLTCAMTEVADAVNRRCKKAVMQVEGHSTTGHGGDMAATPFFFGLNKLARGMPLESVAYDLLHHTRYYFGPYNGQGIADLGVRRSGDVFAQYMRQYEDGDPYNMSLAELAADLCRT